MRTHRRLWRYAITMLLGAVAAGGLATAALLLLGSGSPASASATCTDTFNDTSGAGLWSTASDWSNGLPTASSFVCFKSGIAGVNYNSTSTTSVQAILNANAVPFTVSAGVLVLSDEVAADQVTGENSTLGSLTISGGELESYGTASATSITLTGGELAPSSTVTDSGPLSWSAAEIGTGGGLVKVAGLTTVTAGNSTPTTPVLNSADVQSAGGLKVLATGTSSTVDDAADGVFELTGGTSSIAPGVTFTGSGSLDIPAGGSLTAPTAAGSNDTATLDIYVYSAGTVTVPAGATLTVEGGSSPGAFAVGAGSVLDVDNCTIGSVTDAAGPSDTSTVVMSDATVSGTLTAGTLEGGAADQTSYFYGDLDVGTLELPANQTLQVDATGTNTVTTAVDLSGGDISGSGTIADAGTFAWTAGYLSGGGGTLDVAGATTITLSNAVNTYNISSYSLVANGTAAISGPSGNASFAIDGGGQLRLDGPTATLGSGESITGSGALVASTSTTLTGPPGSGETASISCYPYLEGPVTVPAGGTLNITNGVSDGTFTVGAGSEIDATNTTLGSVIDPAGPSDSSTLLMNNATIAGAVTVGTLEGGSGSNTSYFSGNLDVGTLEAPSSQTLQVDAPGTNTVTTAVELSGGAISGSGTIADAGTFSWTAGYLGGSGGELTVAGATTINLSDSASTYYISGYALVARGTAAISGPTGDAAFGIDGGGFIELAGATASIGPDESITGDGAFVTSPTTTLTAPTTAASNDTASITCYPYLEGPVTVPAGATLSVQNGSSPATFTVGAGSVVNATSTTLGSVIDPSGSSGTSSLVMDNATISGTVAVGTLSGVAANTGTSYFYGTVTVGTLDAGTASAASGSPLAFFSPATVTVKTAATLNGATISGSSTINDEGTFNWYSGSLGGSGGTLEVAGKTTIKTSTGSNPEISGYTLEANGSASITAGSTPGFEIQGGASVVLNGPTAAIDQGYVISGSGPLVVGPTTTLTVPTTAVNPVSISTLENEGVVTVPGGGTLSVGSGVSTGSFSLVDGATLNLAFATVDGSIGDPAGVGGTSALTLDNTTVNGPVTVNSISTANTNNDDYLNGQVAAGTIAVPADNLAINAAGSVATGVSVTGGVLSGSGTIADAGTLTWTGGSFFGGDGTLDVAGQSDITLSTQAGTSEIESYTVDAAGSTSITAPVTDPGFEISSGGALDLTGSAAEIDPGYTVTGGSVLGVGPSTTLTVGTSSTSPVLLDVALENAGDLTVPAGESVTVGGGTSTGSFSVTSGSVLALVNATTTGPITDAAGTSGTSTLSLDSSTADGAVTVGAITAPSATGTSYLGGQADAGTLTTSSQQFNLTSGAQVTVANAVTLDGGTVFGVGTLTDSGTFTWNSGDLGQFSSQGNGHFVVHGSSTIDPTTASDSYIEAGFTVDLLGTTTITTAPAGASGFELNEGTLILAGTSSIANGVTIAGGNVIVPVGGTLTVPAASGTATISSAFVTSGSVVVPAGGTLDAPNGLNETGGTIDLAASSSAITTNDNTSSYVQVNGGTLEGLGTITADVENSLGTVEGGTPAAAGTLTISSTYVQGLGGTLQANVGGSTAGSTYSQVDASLAQLNGTLNLSVLGSYVPPFSSSYLVLATSGGLPSGTFAQVTPALFGPRSSATTYGSTGVTVTSAAALTPTVAVALSPDPSVTGQQVSVTATVTGPSGSPAPTGTVTVKFGTTTIGSGQLSGGTFTASTSSLPAGSDTISVAYGGDEVYAAPASPATKTETVNAAATTTKLAASPTSAKSGATVKLTATVAAVAPGAGTPTGTVTFKLGSKTLGTGSLAGGKATLSTKTLPVGSDKVTAVFAGTSSYAASTSAAVTIKVTAAAAPRRVSHAALASLRRPVARGAPPSAGRSDPIAKFDIVHATTGGGTR